MHCPMFVKVKYCKVLTELKYASYIGHTLDDTVALGRPHEA
jgi:hypothetical protein